MNLSERQDAISAAAAHAAVWAAVEAGYAMNVRVNAAVVDAAGNLAAFLRAPGAFLHSIGFARDKAHTAAGFGIPTERLFEMVKDEPRLRESLSQADRLTMIGGGLPIHSGGRIIGGIGVSGGTEAQDIACCEAALRALGLLDG